MADSPHDVRGRGPRLPIPEGSLAAFVLRHAQDCAARPALIDATTGRTLSYAELLRRVRAFAGALRAQGFARGNVLALLAPNSPEYAVAAIGTLWAGGTLTTLNPSYTEREVRSQLLDSGAVRLVATQALESVARAAISGTRVAQLDLLEQLPEGAGIDCEPASGDALAALLYSSGTTGVPKGVMLTHRALIANLLQTAAVTDCRQSDVLIAVLPFFHCYGLQVCLNMGLAHGATVVTMPRFDLQGFLDAHARHRVTMSFVAPPIMVALAKHPDLGQFDLSSLRFMLSGAAPLSAELGAEVAQRVGCRVLQGYGMTELGPVSHVTQLDRIKPGSVGPPVANSENRVVDVTTGAALPLGREGELWVRSDAGMSGYLNQPQATAATLDAEGWVHTGDIARIDDDGHVYIVDRLKELIKVSGFQVAPAELEGLLLTHPSVADAAVIGVADEKHGEVPIGFVVLKAGAAATADSVMQHVARDTAHYKHLRRVEFIAAIPKSPSGKILRRLLRDSIAARSAASAPGQG